MGAHVDLVSRVVPNKGRLASASPFGPAGQGERARCDRLGLQFGRERSEEREFTCHDSRDVLLEVEVDFGTEAAIGADGDSQRTWIGAFAQEERASSRPDHELTTQRAVGAPDRWAFTVELQVSLG